MPDTRAASKLPPTAKISLPRQVLVCSTHTISITTSAIITMYGTPNKLAEPMSRKLCVRLPSGCERLGSILKYRLEKPKMIIWLPSVAKKAGTFSFATTQPLKPPSTTPTSMATSTGTKAGSSGRPGQNFKLAAACCASDAETSAVRPTMRPPERSAEPDTMMNIQPIATTMRTALCIKMSRATSSEKNRGEMMVMMTTSATKIR